MLLLQQVVLYRVLRPVAQARPPFAWLLHYPAAHALAASVPAADQRDGVRSVFWMTTRGNVREGGAGGKTYHADHLHLAG